MVSVHGYDIDLDLTRGGEGFGSRTRVRFACNDVGGSTFIEHFVPRIHSVVLNGSP